MKTLFSTIGVLIRYGRLIRWIDVMNRKTLVLLTTCFMAIAASAGATDDVSMSPSPKNAKEIVDSLRDVIVHGDLADLKYYSSKFGVTLKGEGIGDVYKWGPMCGKVWTGRVGQYFNNSSTPWYFDLRRKFVNRCGEYPYQQEFLQNGQVRVVAYIRLDAGKVCITTKSVADALIGLKYDHGPYHKEFAYFFDGINRIELMLLPSGVDDCVGMLNLLQNQSEDGKND